MNAALNYGTQLFYEVRDREERVARALYAAWNANLDQPSWENANDGTRWKWRRLARIAIAEMSK